DVINLSDLVDGITAHEDIDFLEVKVPLDAAVLRQAAHGVVQVRHDLDARYDGAFEFVGQGRLLDEGAVHAVPHAHGFLVRLDVDMRGPQLHRVGKHVVHQPQQRRLPDIVVGASV